MIPIPDPIPPEPDPHPPEPDPPLPPDPELPVSRPGVVP
jgi:hypothetical protein